MMTTPLPSDNDEVDLDLGDEDDAAPVDDGATSHLDEYGQSKIIERHLIVPPELAGLRLDHFVKTQIQRLSRTKIQAIIETQLRRVDGGKAKPSTTVALGDHFIIRRQAK